MAIYIDIYARLKKQALVKEGEELKRYVDSLERNITARMEKGAQGRSTKLIKYNDAYAASFDRLINASDSWVKAVKRETDAKAELVTITNRIVRTEKEAEEQAKDLAAAERELASAQMDRVYVAQQLVKSVNDETRAGKTLNDEKKAHASNLRQVTSLSKKNTTEFRNLARATNKQRRELESLNTANQDAIKDGKGWEKQLRAVADATKRTGKERNKYKKMLKEEGITADKLRVQTERITEAYEAEQRVIADTTAALNGMVTARKLHTVTAKANRASMHDQAKAAFAASRQINNLRASNAGLIQSNALTSRSFDAVQEATNNARKEHQKYTRLVSSGAGQDKLREQAEKVSEAYSKQGKAVLVASESLNDLARARNRADIVVQGNANRLNFLSSQAVATSRSIDDLKNRNIKLYQSSGVTARAFLAVADATDKAQRAHQEYNRMISRGATQEQLRRQLDTVTDAYVRQQRAAENATSTLANAQRQAKEQRRRQRDGGLIGRVLTELPFVPGGRAGAVIGSGMLLTMAQAAEAAVTASQALALLPAAGAAATAGILTLTVGMHGFLDTVGDMGDPKKFAEGLQTLTPAAQQAALEIKSLVDGPLGDLKSLTQETLFQGVSQQLHNLATNLLPPVQRMMVGVADSANNAFMNFTNELQTPESLKTINEIADNIVAAFVALEPAVAPFTQAMLTITDVGASFLPGLTGGITTLAEEFNAFIQTSKQDGSLQEFMQRGIDAAKLLGAAILDIGTWVYQTFGNKTPAEFKETLDAAVSAVKVGIEAIVGLGNALNTVLGIVRPIAEAVGGWENLFILVGGAIIAWKARGVIKVVAELLTKFTGISSVLSKLPGVAGTAASGITAALARIKIPPAVLALLGPAGIIAAGVTGAMALSSEFGNDLQPGTAPFNPGPRAPGAPGAPAPAMPAIPGRGMHWEDGKGWVLDTSLPQGIVAPSHQVPGNPDHDQLWTDITAGDPNRFMPDLSGITPPSAVTGGTGALQWGNGGDPYAKPGYGYYERDQDQIESQYNALTQSAQALRDARIEAEIAQRDGISSQREIFEAKEQAAKAEQDFNEQQARYQKALIGDWKKADEATKNAFEDLNAGLDSDLGLSRGLSGLADNAVRFFGKMAAAPLLGILKGAIGNKSVDETGSGLIGILTAGMATDPKFYGPGYGNPNPAAGPDYYTLPAGSLGGMPVPVGGGGYTSDAALLANVPTGGSYTQDATRDITKGLTDCSSSIGDLINIIDGKPAGPAGGPRLSTHNAPEWLTAAGFQPGAGGPGDFQVGFDGGHMQATLPGGTHLNYGNSADIANRGIAPNSGGAAAMPTRYFRRMSAGGVPVAGAPAGGLAGSLYQDPSGRWRSTLPGWDHLIQRESTGINQRQGIVDVNSGGNEAEGLFQITPQTWANNGGQAFAPSALSATPQEQAEIATRIFRANPNGSDWGMGLEGRENPAQLMAELMGAGPGVPGGAGIVAPGGVLPGAAVPGVPGVPTGSGMPVFVTNWPAGGGFGGGGGGVPGVPGGGVAGGTPHGIGGAPGPGNGTPHGGGGAPGPGAANRNTPGGSPPVPGGGKFNPAALPQALGGGAQPGQLNGVPPATSAPYSWSQHMFGSTGNGVPWTGDLSKPFSWRDFMAGGGGTASPGTPWTGDHSVPWNPSNLMIGSAGANAPLNGVPGATSAPFDMFNFMRPGEVPIVAHSNEHILNGDDVNAMGGQGAVFDFRRMLHGYDEGGIPGQPPKAPPPGPPPGVPSPPKPQLKNSQLANPALTPGPAAPAVQPLPNAAIPAGMPVRDAVATLPQGAAPAGTPVAPTTVGSEVGPYEGYGSGLSISGGIIGALAGGATSAGGMAIDAMAPGAGMAASAAIQIGIQEIQRAIEFAGQAAGIGVQGMMETFLPAGGSALAQENWITRIAGGITGAMPTMANTAGGALAEKLGLGKGEALPGVGPSTPEQLAAQAQSPVTSTVQDSSTRNGIGYVDKMIVQSGTEDALGESLVRHIPAPGAR